MEHSSRSSLYLLIFAVIMVVVSCDNYTTGGLTEIEYTGNTEPVKLHSKNFDDVTNRSIGWIDDMVDKYQMLFLKLYDPADTTFDYYVDSLGTIDEKSYSGCLGNSWVEKIALEDDPANPVVYVDYNSFSAKIRTATSFASCEDRITGTVSTEFSNSLWSGDDLNSGTLYSTLDRIRVRDNVDLNTLGFTITGTIEETVTSKASASLTMNLMIRNEITSKTHKLENVVVRLDNNAKMISVDGRFYDHDYGYSDIITTTEIEYIPRDPVVDPGATPEEVAQAQADAEREERFMKTKKKGILVLSGNGGSTVNIDFSVIKHMAADVNGDGIHNEGEEKYTGEH